MEPDKMSYPWFALQIRGHYENIVTAHLRGKGCEWYLPVYKSRRPWSNRYKEMERALFPGYLFSRFNPLDRLPILIIPGVTRIVGVAKNPVPIDETEMPQSRPQSSPGSQANSGSRLGIQIPKRISLVLLGLGLRSIAVATCRRLGR